jgi:hypothetical protein
VPPLYPFLPLVIPRLDQGIFSAHQAEWQYSKGYPDIRQLADSWYGGLRGDLWYEEDGESDLRLTEQQRDVKFVYG